METRTYGAGIRMTISLKNAINAEATKLNLTFSQMVTKICEDHFNTTEYLQGRADGIEESLKIFKKNYISDEIRKMKDV